jgi:hypothetical protein
MRGFHPVNRYLSRLAQRQARSLTEAGFPGEVARLIKELEKTERERQEAEKLHVERQANINVEHQRRARERTGKTEETTFIKELWAILFTILLILALAWFGGLNHAWQSHRVTQQECVDEDKLSRGWYIYIRETEDPLELVAQASKLKSNGIPALCYAGPPTAVLVGPFSQEQALAEIRNSRFSQGYVYVCRVGIVGCKFE